MKAKIRIEVILVGEGTIRLEKGEQFTLVSGDNKILVDIDTEEDARNGDIICLSEDSVWEIVKEAK